jgi:lipid-A-disaccharide synthase
MSQQDQNSLSDQENVIALAQAADSVSVEESKGPLIGIVVGETSGDMLGAGLIRALRVHFPNAVFQGIGGPKMLAEGFDSLFPQDRLAVMGLVEPLARLPELLNIRRRLRKHFLANRPAVFIGIDSPDFNLDLELSLRREGIKTVHYVSPSVWAWRQGRIKKIARAVDHMLALLPFEADFYREHKVPVTYVGHPLADQIPLEPDPAAAVQTLGLGERADNKKIIALMPGSRSGEVARMGPVFWQMAEYCSSRQKNLLFLVPSANKERHEQLGEQLKALSPQLPIELIEGRSHQIMEAADVVVMASGTTTLEAMLFKRPMVIAYKLTTLTFWLLSRLVKVKYIGLPNLLAGKGIVPEFIQDRATPVAIGDAVLNYLNNPSTTKKLLSTFTDLHLALKKNADETAASAIADLINRGEK